MPPRSCSGTTQPPPPSAFSRLPSAYTFPLPPYAGRRQQPPCCFMICAVSCARMNTCPCNMYMCGVGRAQLRKTPVGWDGGDMRTIAAFAGTDAGTGATTTHRPACPFLTYWPPRLPARLATCPTRTVCHHTAVVFLPCSRACCANALITPLCHLRTTFLSASAVLRAPLFLPIPSYTTGRLPLVAASRARTMTLNNLRSPHPFCFSVACGGAYILFV